MTERPVSTQEAGRRLSQGGGPRLALFLGFERVLKVLSGVTGACAIDTLAIIGLIVGSGALFVLGAVGIGVSPTGSSGCDEPTGSSVVSDISGSLEVQGRRTGARTGKAAPSNRARSLVPRGADLWPGAGRRWVRLVVSDQRVRISAFSRSSAPPTPPPQHEGDQRQQDDTYHDDRDAGLPVRPGVARVQPRSERVGGGRHVVGLPTKGNAITT
jgi:hypothetical protein